MNETKKFTIASLTVGKVQTEDQACFEALEREVAKVASLLSEHIEKFACAFAEEVGLDPTKIKMVKQLTDSGLGFKIWFEPFPSDSEIEIYRFRAEQAEAINVAMKAFVERLIEVGGALASDPTDQKYYYPEVQQNIDDWDALIAERKEGEK